MVQSKSLKAAKEILLGSTRAPPTEETAVAIDALVSMPVTDSERRAQAEQVRITQSTLPLARQPRKRTLSLCLNALNLQAAPGPSGARNGLIRATSDVPGGYQALAAYVTM